MKKKLWVAVLAPALAVLIGAGGGRSSAEKEFKECSGLPSRDQLRTLLQNATNDLVFGPAGGIFDGKRMWGAVVNSDGELCTYTTSTPDPRDVWPGSQAISKTKAYTANAYNVNAGPGV